MEQRSQGFSVFSDAGRIRALGEGDLASLRSRYKISEAETNPAMRLAGRGIPANCHARHG